MTVLPSKGHCSKPDTVSYVVRPMTMVSTVGKKVSQTSPGCAPVSAVCPRGSGSVSQARSPSGLAM